MCELPMLPRSIKRWMEIQKTKGLKSLDIIGDVSNLMKNGYTMTEEEFWVSNNLSTFVLAYDNGIFRVEPEKKFVLRLNNKLFKNKDDMYLSYNHELDEYFLGYKNERNSHPIYAVFTERELKNMDETGFERVPVKD